MLGLSRLSIEGKVGIATGVVFFSILISRTLISDLLDKDTRAWLFRIQFMLFISSLLLIGSLYIWKRVVRRLCGVRGALSWSQRCWSIAVLMFLALAHGSYLSMLFLVGTEPHWLALLSFSCLGAYIILLFFLFAFGCASRLYGLLPRGETVQESQGGGSVRQTVLALILTALLTIYGLVNAAQPPRVVQVEVPLEKLPISMNGLRVAVLSDIHLGPTVGRYILQRIVTMVNQLDPDLVVIVGDLTDAPVSKLRAAAEPLGMMKSRLGSYFVTGNHDYYTADVESWFEFLRSMGVVPLHNSHARIHRPGMSQDWICLGGIDDLEATLLRYPGHGMDVEQALSGCSSENPIILLAHQPHAAKHALLQRPDINLVLSGHTHAGQIFPLSIMAFLINPFFCGLYRVSEHTHVYVTPGTVYYGIPMRIGSRAEITEIILKTK